MSAWTCYPCRDSDPAESHDCWVSRIIDVDGTTDRICDCWSTSPIHGAPARMSFAPEEE